jgi:hypothetical protein
MNHRICEPVAFRSMDPLLSSQQTNWGEASKDGKVARSKGDRRDIFNEMDTIRNKVRQV